MKKQSGFTLIELVIVVVILGFLAVTAIPKFIDLTDQAKQANIEGMAGGFATGVSLARAQWEAEGRPTSGGRNVVNYDGTNVLLTTADNDAGIRAGYIVASVGGQNDGNTLGNDFNEANCIDVWNTILQQPPTLTDDSDDIDDFQYFVTKHETGADTECRYHLKETLNKSDNGAYETPGDAENQTNFFSYFPATSAVAITINN
ncbi:type II secretion system protein [Thalassotalea ganghwensis]